jgi:hypothetical protein
VATSSSHSYVCCCAASCDLPRYCKFLDSIGLIISDIDVAGVVRGLAPENWAMCYERFPEDIGGHGESSTTQGISS